MNPTNVKAAVLHYLAWLAVLGAVAASVASTRSQTRAIEQLAQPSLSVPEYPSAPPGHPLVPRVHAGMAFSARQFNSISDAVEGLDERIKRLEAGCVMAKSPPDAVSGAVTGTWYVPATRLFPENPTPQEAR